MGAHLKKLAALALTASTLSSCGVETSALIGHGDSPAFGEPSPWRLVWSDDFDGNTLDAQKWVPETSCWGGGNNERQCYTDSPNNISVANGVLTLKAQKEDVTGLEFPQDWDNRGALVTKDYTSGKVRTKGLAHWTYGRFEARIKLPKGQSAWSAFWMLPEDDRYGTWPRSGEIDIMEAVNLGAACDDCGSSSVENRTSGALHFGEKWPDNQFVVKEKSLPDSALVEDAFHVYGMVWRKGQIDWYVDGTKFFTVEAKDWFTPAMDKASNPNAPFDQPFYLMLNLAVGGNLPDTRNEGAFNPESFPNEMVIDWVKVYQCETDDNTSGECAL